MPAFYYITEIHQPENTPVRPILSNVKPVSYNVSKHLGHVPDPLVEKTAYLSGYIQDFVETIKNIRLGNYEVATSNNVCVLFTHFSQKQAVHVVNEKLTENTPLSDRTDLSIQNIVFPFQQLNIHLAICLCYRLPCISHSGD